MLNIIKRRREVKEEEKHIREEKLEDLSSLYASLELIKEHSVNYKYLKDDKKLMELYMDWDAKECEKAIEIVNRLLRDL